MAVLAGGLLAAGCVDDGGSGTASEDRGGWLIEAMEDPVFQEACDQLEYCAEPLHAAPGPAEPIWRVRVVREAPGVIRIAAVDAVEVPEGDGVPVGPVAGDYLVVGLDAAGEPVDGQLLRFPDSLRIELIGARALQRRVDLGARAADAFAYLRALPTIERIVVQDDSGAVVDSSEPPGRIADSGVAAPAPPWGFTSPAWARFGAGVLPPYCSHVVVLYGEDDRDLAANLAFDVLPDVVRELATEYAAEAEALTSLDPSDFQPTLVRPGPYQLATVKSALGRMTPLLCQSVGRIAFASFPAMRRYAVGAVFQAGGGDLMMVNVDSGYDEASLRSKPEVRVFLEGTLIHEAGHCAEALLNAQGASPGVYGGEWRPPARTVAEKTIDQVRLRGGFGTEWRRVHDAFTALGWARPYEESGLVTRSTAQLRRDEVVRGGFMTSYGANIWWDDIAEFVSKVYVAADLVAAGWAGESRFDAGCAAMQGHREKNVPASLAAVYTKLLFVRDLGLVPSKLADDCAGSYLGLPRMTPGFEIWAGGESPVRSFNTGVAAGIGTETMGNRVFEMTAAGESGFMGEAYPTTVKLRLDLGRRLDTLEEVPWPRGPYQLGLFGDNNLQLRLDGAPAGNFDAMDGYALVIEASNRRVAGSVFLTKVMRLHAPLPVPEVYDPPLVFRFLLER